MALSSTLGNGTASLTVESKVRRLIAEFAQATDDYRFDDVFDPIAEDAVFKAGDTELRGRKAIAERIVVPESHGPAEQALLDQHDWMIDGNDLGAASDFLCVQTVDGQLVHRSAGRVIDLYARDGDGLILTEREFVTFEVRDLRLAGCARVNRPQQLEFLVLLQSRRFDR
jgi:hypothetical protein